MNTQKAQERLSFKDFFYFTKSKLITFILLIILFQIIITPQNQILGNITIFMQAMAIIVIYLMLSIFWFAFLSKKHFFVSLLLLFILLLLGWYSNIISIQKRERIETECLKENNSTARNIEVIRCMNSKGIKFYR
jgi:hypothetical protein